MGLSTYFEKKGDAGIVIFAGKGGLGKTTCSAGLSHYMASKRNRKVLCFSTDPQASLSDIFDRDIFGKGVIPVIPHLDVVEIDADRRVADYRSEEHTSEPQSQSNLVCRLLLEKKKNQ